MLKNEFEERTGFYPSQSMYTVIERYYMNSKLDKDEFCKAYMENKDGLAEKVRFEVDMTEAENNERNSGVVDGLQKQIKKLQAQLEKEQEWRPYVDKNAVSDEDYFKLRNFSAVKLLSDEKAKDILNEEFGFDRCKVRILNTAPILEVNRHRQIRKTGEVERIPLYDVSDWNYILFECCGIMYEMYNGDLRSYVY